jgi:hypothetical protein
MTGATDYVPVWAAVPGWYADLLDRRGLFIDRLPLLYWTAPPERAILDDGGRETTIAALEATGALCLGTWHPRFRPEPDELRDVSWWVVHICKGTHGLYPSPNTRPRATPELVARYRGCP